MTKGAQEPPLARRLVVLTGASSGVGYATVRRLILQEGANVVAIGRRRMFRIESLATQVEPGRLTSVTGDMANRDNANLMIAHIIEQFGYVDAFIHSINRALRHTALEVTDSEFDLTMQVNVKSALYGLQAIAPHFRRQRSGIVAVYNPTPLQTPEFVASEAVYSASANALSALTAGWARQLQPYNVVVKEITPAPTTDSMLAAQTPHDELLVEVIRTALFPDAPESGFLSDPPQSVKPVAHEPTVITQRGGLRLTSI